MMIQSIGLTAGGTLTGLVGRRPREVPSRWISVAPNAREARGRSRFLRRGLPVLAGVAGAALCAGALVGVLRSTDDEQAAGAFARAWEHEDYGAMQRLLTPEARARVDRRALARAYRDAATTATAGRVSTGETDQDGDAVLVPVAVRTRAFGEVRGDVRLPMADGHVAWGPDLAFPGLHPGERLSRRTRAPQRADILTRDGKTIASGAAATRSVGLGEAGASVAGTLGPPPSRAEARDLDLRGFPPGSVVGISGLERILDVAVAGQPGGELRAGRRVLARSTPRPARAVRTTLDREVQAAAAGAIAGRLGGAVALDARTGEIRGLAGIAFSAPQPPGSTFKIVTATAALERRVVRPGDRFPVQTKTVIDGTDLENANGESCGGTFAQSFARSCNSVFAPLGVKVGARRLLATARRYGFDEPPGIPGALRSTLPSAADVGTPFALGSTAIGQGRLLATPLLLASMAQTVANGGERRRPTIVAGRRNGPPVRVTSPAVARTVGGLMADVVAYGTGTKASLAPVKVAGKTGTAELENTTDDTPPGETSDAGSDTDAWFTSYAPLSRPRVAVAVLLVKAGAGGDTAAPAAKQVLQAALRSR